MVIGPKLPLTGSGLRIAVPACNKHMANNQGEAAYPPMRHPKTGAAGQLPLWGNPADGAMLGWSDLLS